jgi:ribosomal protein S17E
VRTKTVKKASRNIIEKYYSKLTLDFDTNKRVAEEVAIIQSKRLRNKIAGFTTVCCVLCGGALACKGFAAAPLSLTGGCGAQHLMKRIQRGPVRGISLKLQARSCTPAKPQAPWLTWRVLAARLLFSKLFRRAVVERSRRCKRCSVVVEQVLREKVLV